MNKNNIIIGSLLGDAYLEKGKRNTRAGFKLKLTATKVEYLEKIQDTLSESVQYRITYEKNRKPSRVNGKICHDIQHWNGEFCYAAILRSRCDEEFTLLREKWYHNRIKVVPRDLVLNSEIVAHWFVQDGCNNITSNSKGAAFCTNGFSESDVDFLIERLKIDLDINSKRYKGPIIRVAARSYFNLINLISPYIKTFSCFEYKIDTTGAPKDRTGELWIGPKINMQIANQIREEHKDTKCTLGVLAKKYNLTVGSIGKIVNMQMYKPKSNLSFCGEAKVKYEYGD